MAMRINLSQCLCQAARSAPAVSCRTPVDCGLSFRVVFNELRFTTCISCASDSSGFGTDSTGLTGDSRRFTCGGGRFTIESSGLPCLIRVRRGPFCHQSIDPPLIDVIPFAPIGLAERGCLDKIERLQFAHNPAHRRLVVPEE